MKVKNEKLTQVISRLVVQQPFFATYLYKMMDIKVLPSDDTSVPTAGTDGTVIYINEGYLDKLSFDEALFLVAHEVMHGVLNHMPRSTMYKKRGFGPDLKPYNHTKANYAKDYVINDMLTDIKLGVMPEGGLLNPHWGKDDIWDEVYLELEDPPESDSDAFDQHMDAADDAPSEQEVKAAVTQAKNAAKAMGQMPVGLERVVSKLLEPKVDWKELLRAYITANAGKDSSTWNKPNRRRLATPPHVYYPGTTGFSMGEIAIVVDTSGSISDSELTAFMSEVSCILDECRPEKCYVLWTDSQVAKCDEVEDVSELTELTPAGGGGTDMEAAFRYMEDEGIYPEMFVVLTDGLTPFNESNEPECEVIWAITTDKVAPYGKTVHLEVM